MKQWISSSCKKGQASSQANSNLHKKKLYHSLRIIIVLHQTYVSARHRFQTIINNFKSLKKVIGLQPLTKSYSSFERNFILIHEAT